MKKIIITKANGQKAEFDPNKVVTTCIRAGADPAIAKQIARQVHSRVRYGMTTKEIYKIVLRFLSENATPAIKQRYRLKESIMKLGPAGFSFEYYIGQILRHYGYKVLSVGAKIQGRCVIHEVDLSLESSDEKIWLAECKYHNFPGRYTGLKESLYTHARFLDLADKFDGEMLVCNTKVSPEAITYATCIGQKLLSWRFPPQMGLEKMIEEKKLYPVTILGPNKRELELLSKSNMMIAKDLLDIDIYEFAQKTRLPIKRLVAMQRLTNQIIS
ncbi:ATP cone domain-containing protein [Candidatus Nitrosotenuis aquarius]|uniref:ATP cone domain-containing protein n=1 Tax=Candidatus Nitrosotenuis aquarius TaxID=1846278 RepID=UPI000E6800EE|nr:ATP cone domain-containing protein [Candidatus Nitrosotenuis aquarius]